MTKKRLPAKRGKIYDVHGEIIADNQTSFRFKLNPEYEITDPKLKDIVEEYKDHNLKLEDALFIKKLITNHFVDRFPDVNPKKLINITQCFARLYIAPEMLAHALGHVATDPENALNLIGKAGGIEQLYDELLRGEEGIINYKRTALNQKIELLEYRKPKHGQDLQVSLDLGLQKHIYKLLEPHRCASIVVIHIPTGQIRALVSKPSYNSNYMSNGYSHADWKKLMSNISSPILNRAMKGYYPAGSVMKVPISVLALNKGVITKNTSVHCSGSYKLGRDTFRCISLYHGTLNFLQALAKSCDVYFYSLTYHLTLNEITNISKILGMIDTNPQWIEKNILYKGKVLNSADIKRIYKRKVLPGDTLQTIIGQGYVSLTPLGLCTMAARVASGKAVIPTFAAGTDANDIHFNDLPISKEALQTVRQGMRSAVLDGTVRRANDGRVHIAGKTGTAQVVAQKTRKMKLPWEKRDHALIVGFAPYEKPEYACSIVVEHGTDVGVYAGTVCAPMLKSIMQYLLDRNALDNKALDRKSLHTNENEKSLERNESDTQNKSNKILDTDTQIQSDITKER